MSPHTPDISGLEAFSLAIDGGEPAVARIGGCGGRSGRGLPRWARVGAELFVSLAKQKRLVWGKEIDGKERWGLVELSKGDTRVVFLA